MHHSKRHRKSKNNRVMTKSKRIIAKGVRGVTNVLEDTTDDFFGLVKSAFGSLKSRKSKKSRRRRR